MLILNLGHLFEEDARTIFLAAVDNIKNANQDENVDDLIRELESVIDLLEQLSEVCPDDAVPLAEQYSVAAAPEEQGDVPPVDNSFPHDAPNLNATVISSSDSESDDDATGMCTNGFSHKAFNANFRNL